MNIVAIYTATGNLKESFSYSSDKQKNTIIADMQERANIVGENITIREMTDAELKDLIDKIPLPPQPPTAEDRLTAVESALLMII